MFKRKPKSPPSAFPASPRRPMLRRPLPSRRPQARPAPRKPSEVDEVLKKLKEIGK